ncbi:2TM domain-containing protein [Sediminibacter sp. Hel_I_10]|uniref:2TM domain-containing protein n=1 Tax=Sediminibacter sp. Hel_I_10 TaxID=1392490 RepID=UPI00047D59B3|nr:2TM domain-containing protein [Sediminibacter sp. Hel_I_10]
MDTKEKDAQNLIQAKQKLRKLKIFYIHLAGYFVLTALLLYNLYIIEDNGYKQTITILNMTTIVVWGVFLFVHGCFVFKGRFLFKRSWEEKKINDYLNKEEGQNSGFWE